MRLSGFASGLDIDAMVKTLMKAHQAPVTKLKQQSTKIEWQQEAYRSVSTSLVDLRNNKLSNYMLSSSINAKKAEVTGNTAAVGASTQGNTTAGIYNVKVIDLASAAQATATVSIKGADADTKLQDIPSLAGKSSISINGKEIAFDAATDTFESLIAKINNSKDANATAIYDRNTGALSITSKTTGGAAIEVDDTFKSLLDNTASDPNQSTWNSIAGAKAAAEINGVRMESDTNQITVNGLNIQLKAESLDSVSTITVSRDTDKIMDTIKSFINDYNSVLDSLNSKLNEDKHRSYLPLSEEEQEAMTEKQVELWESKAKSGLLKNDTILSSLVSNMRAAIIGNFGDPNDKFNLQSIGISTGKWEDRGKLVIENEDALKRALEADPDQVISLFTARRTGETPDGVNKATDADAGIFTRLSNILMDSIVQLSNKAGTSRTSTALTGNFLENSLLSTQKREITNKISDYNSRLLRIENQYYKQFTAMETAINRYNSQAGSIANFSTF